VNGDIPKAMRGIETLAPGLLKTRANLQFQLHCQQFIGLVKANEVHSFFFHLPYLLFIISMAGVYSLIVLLHLLDKYYKRMMNHQIEPFYRY
jgi:hypothetical protein